MKLKKTNDQDIDFISLTRELDEYFYKIYGDAQKKHVPNNVLKTLNTVLVGYIDEKPMACGCFRVYDEQRVEIKRMYVKPEFRGKGYASNLLFELEKWAKELGFKKAILESGEKQLDAIRLYQYLGYKQTANYGVYEDIKTSVCMEKTL